MVTKKNLAVLLTVLPIIFAITLFAHARKADLPQGLREAMYYEKAEDGNVQCRLCPRMCLIAGGQKGYCRARKNIGGTLYALDYGRPVAMHVDPVEKKPFFHVYPGTKSFSIATAGCNLRCKFCQNWEISQMDAEDVDVEFCSPADIVKMAKDTGSKTIAFTYTEPTVFFEYMLDIAKLAKAEGVACVMHSAGYINDEPLKELAQYLTAADIDLKSFKYDFYDKFCNAEPERVKRTIAALKGAGVWVEITNLIIPTANDSDDEIKAMCGWIRDTLGPDTPLHFSRFTPMFKLTNLSPTPVSTLERAKRIADEAGLRYVYIGNVPGHQGEDTVCPRCYKIVIKRMGYFIVENNLRSGACKFCGNSISGVW